MGTAAKKTWKPTVAGILDIVAGGLSLTVLLLVFIGLTIFMPFTEGVFPFNISLLLLFIIAIPGIPIGALAVIGGVEVGMDTCWLNCCHHYINPLRYSSYYIHRSIQERV